MKSNRHQTGATEEQLLALSRLLAGHTGFSLPPGKWKTRAEAIKLDAVQYVLSPAEIAEFLKGLA